MPSYIDPHYFCFGGPQLMNLGSTRLRQIDFEPGNGRIGSIFHVFHDIRHFLGTEFWNSHFYRFHFSYLHWPSDEVHETAGSDPLTPTVFHQGLWSFTAVGFSA